MLVTSLRGRISAIRGEPLYANAVNLMATTGLTGLVGIAFWAVAARVCSTQTVGRDSALINAMVGLSAVCQLNLIDTLIWLLPGVQSRRRAKMVFGAYGVSTSVALVGGAAFAVVAPRLIGGLRFMRGDIALVAGFVAATAAWGVFNLQDAALTAVRKTRVVLVENLVFSCFKLGLVAGLGGTLRHVVFVSWVVPVGLLIPIVNVVLYRQLSGAPDTSSGAGSAKPMRVNPELLRFLAQDYGAHVLRIASCAVLPIIVLARGGSTQSAYFAIPFSIAMALELLVYNAASSLTVEGAYDRGRAAALTRAMTSRLVLFSIVGAAVIAPLAPVILLPYGSRYASHGQVALAILAAGLVTRSVVYVVEAHSRLHGQGGRILTIELSIATFSIGSGMLVPRSAGLTGFAASWVIPNLFVAVVLLPRLLQVVRRRDATPTASLPRYKSDTAGLGSTRSTR